METAQLETQIGELQKSAKAAHEKLQNTFTEFKSSYEESSKELLKKGDLDPLLEEKNKKMIDDIVKMQASIDDLTVKMNRPKFGTDSYDEKDAEFRNAKKFQTDVAITKRQIQPGRMIKDSEVDLDSYTKYKEALTELYRVGDDRKLSPDMVKALSVGTNPDGGYTVTPERSNKIIERQFESSPMRQVVTVETISSAAFQILEDPEEFGSSRTGERSSEGETSTGNLGLREITPKILEARPRVTQMLLDDSSIDIEAYIDRKVAAKFGRDEARESILGDGVKGGRGMTTYTAGTAWGEIEQINSGANGGVTYAQLAAISTSLKENYYPNASWLLHRTLIGKILALSGNDTPLWIPSIAVGQPSTLLGYPVRFAQDFAVPATNSLSGAFGDFRAGYTWVDRIGVRVQPDPYTVKPFIEYYTTKRSSGDVLDFDAIKIIKLAA
jgi:HK97 family phage major capsid protein